MNNRIFEPAYLLTDTGFEKGMAVAVSDDTIVKAGKKDSIRKEYPLYDYAGGWEKLIMIPGCVNIHNHSFQSLLRGLCCDKPFLQWREESLYHYSPLLSKEHIYIGAMFSFNEMMKCGVTAVSDFFYLHKFGTDSDEMIIQAAHDTGIRLVLSRTMYDWNGAPHGYCETVEQAVSRIEYLAEKYHDDKMITVVPSPHSLHAASTQMIIEGAKLAQRLDTSFHMHVAEELFEVEQVKKEHGGMTPIEYLDSIGILNERMVLIHGVYLKPDEIECIGRKGAKLAYCPSSNMFLADGITDIPSMVKNNVLIGLGSDGACANSRNSIFEEMRMAALLQKVSTGDAMCINYKQVFDMGTKNGAEILGLKSGKITPGYFADFVGIDPDDLSMQPISDSAEQILPNMVYSMQPSAVKNVMVGGRQTVKNGKLTLTDENDLVLKIKKVMAELKA